MELSEEQAKRMFPEKIYECPYCHVLVTMPAGRVAVECNVCEGTVFRPLPKLSAKDLVDDFRETVKNYFSFPDKRIPETPLIGIRLNHVPYVCCPADDENMIPASECYACDCFDVFRSLSDHVVCHYVDDNRDIASVIRNKEQIIAACIRGRKGYDSTCRSDGTVRGYDPGEGI